MTIQRPGKGLFAITSLVLLLFVSAGCSEYFDLLPPPINLSQHPDPAVQAAAAAKEAADKEQRAKQLAADARDTASIALIDEAIIERPRNPTYRWGKAAIAVANGEIQVERDSIAAAKGLQTGSGNDQAESYIDELFRVRSSLGLQEGHSYDQDFETDPPSEEWQRVNARYCDVLGNFDFSEEGRRKFEFWDRNGGRFCD